MRKYLRGLAKANMQRLGFNRVNRRMRYWRQFITKETTDKSILQALGPAYVRKFQEYQKKMYQKRENQRMRRLTA